MQRIRENVINHEPLRRIIVCGLLGVCVLSALFYGYLVNRAVFNTVEIRRLGSESSVLLSNLNSLEERYLSLKHTTTMERAKELGFSEVANPKFISKKSLGQGLSLRDRI